MKANDPAIKESKQQEIVDGKLSGALILVLGLPGDLNSAVAAMLPLSRRDAEAGGQRP